MGDTGKIEIRLTGSKQDVADAIFDLYAVFKINRVSNVCTNRDKPGLILRYVDAERKPDTPTS